MGTIVDILAVAPRDVAEAIRWLITCDASVVSVEPWHGMGFALAELVVGDIEVRVVSDRDEWSIALRRAGRTQWLQFDLIHAVMVNEDWSDVRRARAERTPVRQHPDGVSWHRTLPDAVAWLRSTPNAEREVALAGRQRAKAMWG